MPLYEYQCRACEKVTDVRHGFDEKNTQMCPACGGELARRFSPTGIVFKGSGFYVTDSRKAGQTASSSAKSESAATDSAKADSTKGDAPKPDAPSTSSSSSPSSGSSTRSTTGKGDTAAA